MNKIILNKIYKDKETGHFVVPIILLLIFSADKNKVIVRKIAYRNHKQECNEIIEIDRLRETSVNPLC